MPLLIFLFSTTERFNRAKYWLYMLVYALVYTVLMVALAFASVAAATSGIELIQVLVLVLPIIAVAMVIPFFTIGIRRLHDRNKGAVWIIPFMVAPYGLELYARSIAPAPDTYSAGGWIALLIGIVLGIWGFVEMGCLPGTQGKNDFGPDPRAKPQVTAAAFD